MVIPLLEPLELAGKTITTDALLTQRKLAAYLRDHHAHYVFTVKDNQPTLREAIRVLFTERGQPDFQESPTLAPRPHRTTLHLDLHPPEPLSRLPRRRSGLRH